MVFISAFPAAFLIWLSAVTLFVTIIVETGMRSFRNSGRSDYLGT
jgi:hypothetical protein